VLCRFGAFIIYCVIMVVVIRYITMQK